MCWWVEVARPLAPGEAPVSVGSEAAELVKTIMMRIMVVEAEGVGRRSSERVASMS